MIIESDIQKARDWAAKPENIVVLLVNNPILFGFVRDEIDAYHRLFGERAAKEIKKTILTIYKVMK